MTWFKIDDSFYDHPKVFDAPDCAVALWTRAGTWSARNLTDGFVPTGMPARLCDDPDTAVKELVRRGLWIRTTGGFRFHDWANYQPSREAVEDLRTKRAEAGRRGGQAKAAKQNGKQTSSNGLASASDVGKQNAAPARPDPSFSGGGSYVAQGGTRASTPPTRCKEHEDDPDPPACRRCRSAREAHEQWQASERQRLAEAPRCPDHPGQLAHNCAPCRSERVGAE